MHLSTTYITVISKILEKASQFHYIVLYLYL